MKRRRVQWLIGILTGLLGLGPRLVSGAQLPLQNLWGAEVVPDQMPVSLRLLSQYELNVPVAVPSIAHWFRPPSLVAPRHGAAFVLRGGLGRGP